MTTIGAPINSQLARYFGIKKDISAALSSDADIRERASRVADLADAARTELVSCMAELNALGRQIRQQPLF